MVKALWNWLLGLFRLKSPPTGPSAYAVCIETEEPEKLEPKTLYLIGEDDAYWLAVLACPCGCGDAIRLPMSPGSSPCWRVDRPLNPPTLWPSIHRTVRCKSHFFLRRGNIDWCRDNSCW